MKKMWDGRFSKPTSGLMDQFNRSLTFDIRLYEEDIKGSKAYAFALQKAGILSSGECRKIQNTLTQIGKDIERGRLRFSSQDEDIHMAVERVLTERAGKIGSKLHTGRSRNDQVATDMRLYVMKIVRRNCSAIVGLQQALVAQAQEHIHTLMPGYTHLQQAQPISLAQYFLSLVFALQRDWERFGQAFRAADCMPLGAGALAGSTFNLNRRLLAKELGFTRITKNSMDAVSDRDFILDFLSAASILLAHLSRYAEDFVIWCTSEFGFMELDDAFATGSSMMPQKKNPDSVELIRGKSGRVFGNLIRLLTVLKGLPLTYAKDLQEDKEAMFDTADTLMMVLPVMQGVVQTARFHIQRMREALSSFLLATDLADVLTKKGMPFRQAHDVVGQLTRFCLKKQMTYAEVDVNMLKSFHPLLTKKLVGACTFEQALQNRNISGGTGTNSIQQQLRQAKQLIQKGMQA